MKTTRVQFFLVGTVSIVLATISGIRAHAASVVAAQSQEPGSTEPGSGDVEAIHDELRGLLRQKVFI